MTTTPEEDFSFIYEDPDNDTPASFDQLLEAQPEENQTGSQDSEVQQDATNS